MIIYTATAAARILKVAPKAIKSIKVWAYVVWVHVQGFRPTLVSKSLFNRDFVEFRQGAGFGLFTAGKVAPTGRDTGVVRVANSNGGTYRVQLREASVQCECPDYLKQVELLGFGVCKHGYAGLNAHGFGTFSAYSEAIATGKRVKSLVGGRSVD